MEESQHSDVAKKPKKSLLKMYTSVLSSPPMLLNLLCHLLNYIGIGAFYSLSTDRAIKFGGVSKAESSLLLSIIGVSNCLGRVVFGHLLDRWKQKVFYEHYCHVCDYFRLRPWTLQLTSIAFLANALAILFGDLITGF